jgi:hypothetical protein
MYRYDDAERIINDSKWHSNDTIFSSSYIIIK